MSSSPKQLSTGIKEFKTIVNCKTNKNGVDCMFDDLSDLVNNDFKPWYCKQFYRLGRKRVEKLASQARSDGFNKQKLFSSLLKRS